MAMDFTRFFTSAVDTSATLQASYDPYMVVASYVIAVLAGFAFLRFAARLGELGQSVVRFMWVVVGAVTMGLGVWAMHFVGMLAYRLPIPVNYDPLITTLSVFPAVAGSAIALYIVASPHVTLPRLAVGALALGAGIGAMHYTGMAALHFDAFVSYDPVLFATSIVVAVALAFAALFATLWSLNRRSAQLVSAREAAGAVILGLAVSGMHYTAMTSAYCIADGTIRDTAGIKAGVFSDMTAIAAVLVLLMVIAGVMFDRRLRLEIARREQIQAQLLQARKMEALGNLAGGIAHEFNNMLMPIIALTELTRSDLPSDHDGCENLSTVLEAAHHAEYLVNQVMVFSRQNDHDLSEVHLPAAVADGVRLLREKTPPTTRIDYASDPNIGTALAEREQIHALILNIGSNAADASKGKDGHIDIELSRLDDAQRDLAAVALDPKQPYARLRMRDNGHGMDAATLENIFNPFFTTKPVGEGTGLGLAMVHGIVQRFGGAIDVKSEPGIGTTFDIYLPLLASATETIAAAA